MRVGERTNFNRLRMFIETDGTMTPREVFEKSIGIMIKQLKAIVGFQEEEEESIENKSSTEKKLVMKKNLRTMVQQIKNFSKQE